MLVYRALLVDTERCYERPVQSYFSSSAQAKDWANKTLAKAGDKAYVQLYRSVEEEWERVKKDDQGATPGVEQAAQKAE